MYFVIQVVSRTENEMMKTIKDYVPKPFIKDIFVPLRKRMKKIDSKWIEYEEVYICLHVFGLSSRCICRRFRDFQGQEGHCAGRTCESI